MDWFQQQPSPPAPEEGGRRKLLSYGKEAERLGGGSRFRVGETSGLLSDVIDAALRGGPVGRKAHPLLDAVVSGSGKWHILIWSGGFFLGGGVGGV